MLDLRTLQRALGGVITNGQLLCAGPGHDPRDRSLAVRLSSDGDFIVYSHSGDDWRACRDYVREKLGWPQWRPGDGREERHVPPSRIMAFDRDAVDVEAEIRPFTEDERIRIERAAEIWDEAEDPRGTLAEQYLGSRALVLSDDVANTVLRFHPACPWRDENTGSTTFIPALIAAFRSIDDDTVTGIHRIALTSGGAKVGRRMFGVVHRAAVKLDPAGGTLAVGEGVETCLAARQLGYAPAWARGSVGAISFFPVIGGVDRLMILGEAGAASARAVRLCSHRWQRAGRKVQLVMPDDGYDDLNSELMKRPQQKRTKKPKSVHAASKSSHLPRQLTITRTISVRLPP